MSRTRVQDALSSMGSGTVAFPSNVVAGNLLVAKVHWNNGSGVTLSSVTDTQGNTWQVIAGTHEYSADTTEHIQQAWCRASSSAACTVTANLSSGTPRSNGVVEYNDSTGQLEFSVANHNTGTSALPTSGSITTPTDHELGIVMISTSNSQPDFSGRGPNDGFTLLAGYTPYWYAADAYNLDIGVAGSYNVTWDMQGTSVPYSMNIATFRVAAAPITLTGSNCTQGNASSTGVVTVDTSFLGANCSQANTATSGAISQVHSLAGANCIQANQGSTGSTDPYSRIKALLAATPLNEWVQANTNSFYDAAVPSGDRAVDPGNQASVIYAWSSFGWDEKKARLILFGGGHANYLGDEVYVWNGDTGLWGRASLPTYVDPADPDLLLPSKDAPQSSHTYANNQYLYNQEMFVTFGGAAANSGDAFTELVTADPRVTRKVGPFVFDMSLSDPLKVGGADGTGYNVARLGSGAWHNRRDLADTYPIDTLDHKQGATAYVDEGGVDVCYFTMGGASGFPNWYKYTFGDVRGGTEHDVCVKIGQTSNSVIFDGFMVHDPVRGMLYRQGATLSGKTSEIAAMPTSGTGTTADTPIQVVDVNGDPFPMVLTPSVYATRYGAVYDDTNDRIWLWDSNGTNPGTVFYIDPPAYDSSTGWASTTWTANQVDPSGSTPRGGHINGVLGKMKYVPTLGAFVVLDSAEATHVDEPGVWFFKTAEATATLAGDSSTQGNASATGAITQAIALTASNCSQGNTSATGSIGADITLTGANCTQANDGTGGAISIDGAIVLVWAPSVQDNIAQSSAIVQAHILAASNVTQGNSSPSRSITLGDALPLRSLVTRQGTFTRTKTATARFN